MIVLKMVGCWTDFRTGQRMQIIRKKFRNLADRAGIIDCISSCGVGEPKEGNTNESMDRVWETVKAHLLRPIPLTAIN
jgi:hypothetical protein